jgi:hypothetical protein
METPMSDYDEDLTDEECMARWTADRRCTMNGGWGRHIMDPAVRIGPCHCFDDAGA